MDPRLAGRELGKLAEVGSGRSSWILPELLFDDVKLSRSHCVSGVTGSPSRAPRARVRFASLRNSGVLGEPERNWGASWTAAST